MGFKPSKSAPHSLHIPLDIIRLIIDELDAPDYTDWQTLKACSLVSHAVLSFCRPHLFSSVILEERAYGKGLQHRYRGLYQVLSQNPHLARHVQTLALHLGTSDSGYQLGQEDTLPKFLDSLDCLRHLRIFCPPIWSRLSDPLSTSFHRLISRSSGLTSVSIGPSDAFPLCYIEDFSNMKHLELRDVTFDTAVNIKSDELHSTNTIQLDSISLQNCWPSTIWTLLSCSEMSSWRLDLTCLRKVSCRPGSSHELLAVWAIMKQCASTLKHFVIDTVDFP